MSLPGGVGAEEHPRMWILAGRESAVFLYRSAKGGGEPVPPEESMPPDLASLRCAECDVVIALLRAAEKAGTYGTEEVLARRPEAWLFLGQPKPLDLAWALRAHVCPSIRSTFHRLD